MTKGRGGICVALPLMLSACGGNGGGTASFTSWSAIQPGSSVVARGVTEEASSTGRSLVSTKSSASITFDAAGHWSNLALRTPVTAVDLDLIGPLPGGFLGATSADSTSNALIADPIALGYQYQTFGIWETQSATDSTVGSFSIGAPTAGSAIPTSGTANFIGNLAGFYVDSAGNPYFAFATVNVGADFGTRTLAFSTADTFIRPDLVTAGNQMDRPDLDLSGKLSYASGTNSFTGDLKTVGTATGGSLSGSTTGQFYGPGAQELGGVFSVSNLSDPTEAYAGAYGAKTTP